MYRSIADFTSEWASESAMTRKVLDHLTDAALSQSVVPGKRTIGRLAWHIILTLVEMPGEAGIKLDGPHLGDPAPTTAAALPAKYAEIADRLGNAVSAQWTDTSLAEDVRMYGETWKKSQVLSALIKHEVHHRGQITVLMRQAGLKVPGTYGPAEEEWAAMGIPAQE